jgi:hypothetical protein
VNFLKRDFAVVERAQNETAAVGAQVTGEIMSCHKEIRVSLRQARTESKRFSRHEPRSRFRLKFRREISRKGFANARQRRILGGANIILSL